MGPNNSGKSLLLREIEEALAPGSIVAVAQTARAGGQEAGRAIFNARQQLQKKAERPKVLEQVRLDPAFETFAQLAADTLSVKSVPYQYSEKVGVGNGEKAVGTEFVLKSTVSNISDRVAHQLLEQFDREGSVPGILMERLIRVDGRLRFELVGDRERGDLHDAPPLDNVLRRLLDDGETRERLRAEVLRAFPGVHVVVDGTRGAELRFGVNPEAPPSPAVELGADPAAVDYHARTTPLAEASDGVNAFVALVAVLLSGPYDVMLVDEPEAYLPAPRQRQLGRLLTDLSRERGGHVIVSTHSPSFLEGCIERDPTGLRVVRLTYDGERGTARLLADDDLRRLALEPLLRNTAALDGLFRDAVVVTEDHNDRVVYQEVSRRLSDTSADVPDPDVLFVSAENKSTLAHLAGPLRRLGVPAVIQGDLDLIHGLPSNVLDCGDPRYWTKELPRTLRAAGVLEAEVARLVDAAREIVQTYRDHGIQRGAIKTKGRTVLTGDDRARLDAWLLKLAEYGVLLVPVGELERWGLAGANKKGREWVEAAFDGMGSDPNDDRYVRPPEGVSADRSAPAEDVWSFVAQMKGWGTAPARGLGPVGEVPPFAPAYRPELVAHHDEQVHKEVAQLQAVLGDLRKRFADVERNQTPDPRPVPNAVPQVGDWFAASVELMESRDRLALALRDLNHVNAPTRS
ncbi:AAA family ATPase [Rubricoccus marinus]|uniref:AAA family ATPase n=1 Tax=Rubricoccus marinus TaxID=716817 RepID=UPI00117B11F9|nr:AAA family ATPase [Rubricoccus marinus]